MSARIPVACAIASLAACVDTFEVALPEVEGARSMLLVAVEGDRVSSVSAVDLPGSVPVALRGQALYALFYRCSVEALRLVPGRLRVIESGGRDVPPTADVFQLDADGRAWRGLDAAPPVVADARLQGEAESYCSTFSFTTVDTGEGNAQFGADLRDGSLLVWMEDGRHVAIDAARTTAVPAPDPAGGRGGWTGGAQRDDGSIWLINGALDLLELREDGDDFEVVQHPAAPASDPGFGWIAVSPAGPLEVYAVDRGGNVYRWDGTTWSQIITCEACRPLDHGYAGVVHAGPDDIYSFAGSAAFHHAGGVPMRLRVDLGVTSSLDSMTFARSSYGAVFGGSNGRLYGERDGEWRSIVEVGGPPVTSIVPLFEGVLFGGEAGEYYELAPALGLCPPVVLAPGDVRSARVRGEELLLFGGRKGGTAFVVSVRPKRAPRACP